MKTTDVTPLILTYNEAPNIGRTLERLTWASDVVVVDSFSDDETLSIASRFKNVRIFQRKFDSHMAQWNFGLRGTGIVTEWVLALDADYRLPESFAADLEGLTPSLQTAGYRARFRYCIGGHPLRKSVYPPVTVLFRRSLGEYTQEGHTQRLKLEGLTEELRSVIDHDDRKSFRRWLESQRKYMNLECEKLARTPFARLDPADRLRKLRIVAPAAIFLCCIFGQGLLLDGVAGLSYALQRTIAEAVLSGALLKRDLKGIFK